MGELARWLLHEDQKELFEHLFATVLNVVFLALVALALWPMGRASLAWQLTKGYWVLWIVLYWTALPLLIFQKAFRVNLYDRSDAYIISGIAVSGLVQAGWSAFAALTLRDFAAGAPVWMAVVFYIIGVLSSYVATAIISTLYMGHIYRFINLLLGIACFILFSVWPAGGRFAYGWFFDLCSFVYGWLFDLF